MAVKSKGVGGWLLALALILGVLIPLAQFSSIRALIANEDAIRALYGENWPVYQTLSIAVITARTIICLWVAYMVVYKFVPSTPRLAVYGIWVALVLLNILSLGLVAIFSPAPFLFSYAITYMFWNVLFCAIATAYLLKSKYVVQLYSVQILS